jgi:hypothetical protein
LKISVSLGSDLKAPSKPEHALGYVALFTERQAALEGQPGRYEPGFVLLPAKSACGLVGQCSLRLCFLQGDFGPALFALKSKCEGIASARAG